MINLQAIQPLKLTCVCTFYDPFLKTLLTPPYFALSCTYQGRGNALPIYVRIKKVGGRG